MQRSKNSDSIKCQILWNYQSTTYTKSVIAKNQKAALNLAVLKLLEEPELVKFRPLFHRIDSGPYSFYKIRKTLKNKTKFNSDSKDNNNEDLTTNLLSGTTLESRLCDDKKPKKSTNALSNKLGIDNFFSENIYSLDNIAFMLNSLSKEQVEKNMSTSLGIYTGNYNVFNSLNRLAQFMNMNGLPKSSVKFIFEKLDGNNSSNNNKSDNDSNYNLFKNIKIRGEIRLNFNINRKMPYGTGINPNVEPKSYGFACYSSESKEKVMMILATLVVQTLHKEEIIREFAVDSASDSGHKISAVTQNTESSIERVQQESSRSSKPSQLEKETDVKSDEEFGGWTDKSAHSMLMHLFNIWGLNTNVPVFTVSPEEVNLDPKTALIFDDPVENSESQTAGHSLKLYKSELSLDVSFKGYNMQPKNNPNRHRIFFMKHQIPQVITFHANGVAYSESQAQINCSLSMVKQLYKFRIIGKAENGTRPGPLGYLYHITFSRLLSGKVNGLSINKPGIGPEISSNNDLAVIEKLKNLTLSVKDVNQLTVVYYHIETVIRRLSAQIMEEELCQRYNHAYKGQKTIVGLKNIDAAYSTGIFLNKENDNKTTKIVDLPVSYQNPKRYMKIAILCSRRVTKKLFASILNKILHCFESTEHYFYKPEELYFMKRQELKEKLQKLKVELGNDAENEEDNENLELKPLNYDFGKMKETTPLSANQPTKIERWNLTDLMAKTSDAPFDFEFTTQRTKPFLEKTEIANFDDSNANPKTQMYNYNPDDSVRLQEKKNKKNTELNNRKSLVKDLLNSKSSSMGPTYTIEEHQDYFTVFYKFNADNRYQIDFIPVSKLAKTDQSVELWCSEGFDPEIEKTDEMSDTNTKSSDSEDDDPDPNAIDHPTISLQNLKNLKYGPYPKSIIFETEKQESFNLSRIALIEKENGILPTVSAIKVLDELSLTDWYSNVASKLHPNFTNLLKILFSFDVFSSSSFNFWDLLIIIYHISAQKLLLLQSQDKFLEANDVVDFSVIEMLKNFALVVKNQFVSEVEQQDYRKKMQIFKNLEIENRSRIERFEAALIARRMVEDELMENCENVVLPMSPGTVDNDSEDLGINQKAQPQPELIPNPEPIKPTKMEILHPLTKKDILVDYCKNDTLMQQLFNTCDKILKSIDSNCLANVLTVDVNSKTEISGKPKNLQELLEQQILAKRPVNLNNNQAKSGSIDITPVTGNPVFPNATAAIRNFQQGLRNQNNHVNHDPSLGKKFQPLSTQNSTGNNNSDFAMRSFSSNKFDHHFNKNRNDPAFNYRSDVKPLEVVRDRNSLKNVREDMRNRNKNRDDQPNSKGQKYDEFDRRRDRNTSDRSSERDRRYEDRRHAIGKSIHQKIYETAADGSDRIRYIDKAKSRDDRDYEDRHRRKESSSRHDRSRLDSKDSRSSRYDRDRNEIRERDDRRDRDFARKNKDHDRDRDHHRDRGQRTTRDSLELRDYDRDSSNRRSKSTKSLEEEEEELLRKIALKKMKERQKETSIKDRLGTSSRRIRERSYEDEDVSASKTKRRR